jgi:hypothetical protein
MIQFLQIRKSYSNIMQLLVVIQQYLILFANDVLFNIS